MKKERKFSEKKSEKPEKNKEKGGKKDKSLRAQVIQRQSLWSGTILYCVKWKYIIIIIKPH